MKSAKFYLEKRKDKKGNIITINVPVRLSMFLNGSRLEYYTGVRLANGKNFNIKYFKEGKVPVKSNEPEAGRINKKLKELKAMAELIYDNALALGLKPSPEYLREKLDQQYKGKTKNDEVKHVHEAFKEFLTVIKIKKSYRTWQKMQTTYTHMENCYSKKFLKLTFADVDAAFIETFRKYFTDDDYLNNTVVKYLRSLREFLNWCKDENRNYYIGNTKFEDIRENDINIIFLNAEEIKHLEKTRMPNERLENVKNVFLFGCYTAMRYSDIYGLKKKNILEDDIRFYITKGKKTTWQEVPLIPQSRAILNKYKNLPGDAALPVISNAKMNEYLKEVMKEAKFEKVMTIREVKGNGSYADVDYRQWELITFHTSRKSFISFAVENGMPELVIKSITGHSKNSRAFGRYFEVSPEKKRKEMKKISGGWKPPKLKAV